MMTRKTPTTETTLNDRHRPLAGLLFAGLLVSLLLAGACGWDRGAGEQAAQPAAESPAASQAETAQPPAEEPAAVPYEAPEYVEQTPSVQPERAPSAAPEPRPQHVAPPAPAATARVEDLAERERRLKAREAELAAREAAVTARESEVAEYEQEGVEPAPEALPQPALAPAESEQVAAAPPPPPPPPKVEVYLGAGTAFDVEFLASLSSATARVGDTFRTRVDGDVYDERGTLAIPAGSEVVGVITEAVPLPKVGGRARLGLKFTDVVLPGGDTERIAASFFEQGKNETGRDAATIGGATAGGAILGRILDRGKKKRGTVLGAIIGAAAGAAVASKTEGEEVEIPAGSVIAIKLDQSLRLQVPQRR